MATTAPSAPAVIELKENIPMPIQKITPFLWFDHQAEEAATFYTSIFPNSKIVKVVRYGAAGPGPAGSAMTVAFQLEGQSFVALNGGPVYKFTPAISFVVNCQTQAEVDNYWEKLSAGGAEVQCGWVKDRFGLSWQIVPTVLAELLADPDPAKSQRVMKAMLAMTKMDIAALKAAYEKT
jgi:predicted 3-demethylubiquinone-9 3-methyltransferase (glyoxalase superfamily)